MALINSFSSSTQTALTTLYSISMNTHDVATVVETVTGTAYVTVPAEKPSVKISVATFETSSEVCEIEVITMTESFTVTVIPTPSESYAAASSALGDATVIGNPSIVTEVQTELSLTAGLPDATVSGNPDIVTNIETQYSISSGLPDATVPGNPLTVTEGQTEYSISSGLPDATVPGNPLTVTEDQTQYSISSGLPDATVSGNPLTLTEIQQSYSVTGSIYTVITVTDLFPPSQETSETVNEDLSTLTRTTTYQTTITEGHSTVVITVTDLCEDSAMSTVAGEAVTAVPPPASPTSTFTKVVFATSGPASTSTKAIYPPYPTANNTIASGPSGTVTVVPVPTTPVMVSGGSKKPEPRGWGGSNGTTNLGCLVMLVAVMMFLM